MEKIESILASDEVSRHVFFPFMFENYEIFWKKVFLFKTDNKYCESVVWRKYAPSIIDVHVLGNIKVTKDRLTHESREYRGAYTCLVTLIRNINTANNISIEVEHDPSNDQGRHHSHLKLLIPENINKPKKNDRSEIVLKLKHVFEPLEECSSEYK